MEAKSESSELRHRTTPQVDNPKQPVAPATTSSPSASPAEKLTSIQKLILVVRVAALLIWLLVTFPMLWGTVWIRLFHPLLRRLGWNPHGLPMDLIQRYWARGTLWVFGIKLIVEGAENVPLDRPCVFLLNHNSNLDPFISMAACPVTPKFIFKKELMWTAPPLGCLGFFCGHVPINRSDRQAAIKSLSGAASRMKGPRGRSILIFPEGSRSLTGHLQEFKKGAFHLAKDSGAPVVVGIIEGSFDLWKPKTFFPKPGVIRLKWLPPLETKEEESSDGILQKIREVFVEELARERKQESQQGLEMKALLQALTILLMFAFPIVFPFVGSRR